MQIQRKLSVRQTVDRSGICTGATLNYLVCGSGNLDQRTEAFELVNATAPQYMGRARKNTVELVRVPGNGTYEFEVKYSLPQTMETKENGDRIWQFDVSCSTEKIFEAKELVKIYQPQSDIVPPDPGTMLRWDGNSDGDGCINGSWAEIPELQETCIATFRESHINNSFKRAVFAAAGKINSKKFHGWSTGEVLFVKASLSPSYTNAKGHKLVDIKYVFRIRPLGTVVRNQLKIEPVSMWNTVWDIPRRNVQNSLMSVGIYESRIYDYANFSVLDI